MIYLDNAATTPLHPKAIEVMTQCMTSTFGNPSSIHTAGREASRLLRQARQKMAELLSTQSECIFFTSGGTESNNTALKGYALAHQDKGKHIITTAIEHHSVLHTLAYLEKVHGFEVTYLKPAKHTISAQQVKDALREDTILVSIMAANNETGAILPISEIGQVLADHQAIFHVDAVQLAGKYPLQPENWGVDFLSISAHKFHGPKGVGLLYAKKPNFYNLLHGGEQEHKRRASTENLTAILGMVTALELAQENSTQHLEVVSNLRQAFLQELEGIDYYINSSDDFLPYVLNIGFKGIDNGVLLTQLDLAGFCVSTGSACTAGTVDPSHVLSANSGDNSPSLKESIRVSFSYLNTPEEVLLLAQKLKDIIGE